MYLGLAALVLLSPSLTAAAKPVAVESEYEYAVRMVQSIDGKAVEFTGLLSARSRVETKNGETRHKVWFHYDLVSPDGSVRAKGVAHRDSRSGGKTSHYMYNYHMNFIQAGRGVVARTRVLTHYVFNGQGELVVLKVSRTP
jgi:hypothetical protein